MGCGSEGTELPARQISCNATVPTTTGPGPTQYLKHRVGSTPTGRGNALVTAVDGGQLAGYHRRAARLLWTAAGSGPLACGPPPEVSFRLLLSPPSDHSVNVGLTLPGFPSGSAGKETAWV